MRALREVKWGSLLASGWPAIRMPPMRRTVFLLVSLLLLPGSVLAQSEPTTATAPAETATLREKLEALRAEHGVPAMGAAILKDGVIVDLAVAGTVSADSEEPVSADDAWHIGSDTKAMTATLAARLVEQGKIGWDTTVAEALPDLEMHEAHRNVTLRQVLAHRGGIPGHAGNLVLFPQLWQIEREMKEAAPRQRRREAAKRILAAAPLSEAGKAFDYSNYGYIVAGAMLEAANEDDWEALMQREVFEPLGITTAGFGPPPRIKGHVKSGGKWTPQVRDNPPVLGPAGTVHLSLGDWAKFAAAQMGEVEGYLKPETLAILHEPVVGEGGPDYALGWGVELDGEKVARLSHAGSNTMWFAIIRIEPGRDVALLTALSAPDERAAGALERLLVEESSRLEE